MAEIRKKKQEEHTHEDVLRVRVNQAKITSYEGVPDWLEEWSEWAHKLLVPDWAVGIDVSDYPNPPSNNTLAHTEYKSEYLLADMTFHRRLKDDEEGHIVVCHEFAHLFLAKLAMANHNMKTIGDAGHKAARGKHAVADGDSFDTVVISASNLYNDAEEDTVVRLSRALVQLRYNELTVKAELKELNDQAKAIMKKHRLREKARAEKAKTKGKTGGTKKNRGK